jgi:hypothetical protein
MFRKSHFFVGNFVEVVSAASRASAANPQFSVPRYLHTAALVRLNRLDEARSVAAAPLELQPGFTISGLASGNGTHGPAGWRAISGGIAGVKSPGEWCTATSVDI